MILMPGDSLGDPRLDDALAKMFKARPSLVETGIDEDEFLHSFAKRQQAIAILDEAEDAKKSRQRKVAMDKLNEQMLEDQRRINRAESRSIVEEVETRTMLTPLRIMQEFRRASTTHDRRFA